MCPEYRVTYVSGRTTRKFPQSVSRTARFRSTSRVTGASDPAPCHRGCGDGLHSRDVRNRSARAGGAASGRRSLRAGCRFGAEPLAMACGESRNRIHRVSDHRRVRGHDSADRGAMGFLFRCYHETSHPVFGLLGAKHGRHALQQGLRPGRVRRTRSRPACAPGA
jgi:hypothetical protein